MILAFLLIGPFLFLGLCAYGWRRKALRHAQEAQGLGLLAANLEGQLKQSEANSAKMAEIAKRAIEAAGEAAEIKRGTLARDMQDGYERLSPEQRQAAQSFGNYISPAVAYCPSCNVSVRHERDEYPVPCPSCQTLIDPVLDNPPEF